MAPIDRQFRKSATTRWISELSAPAGTGVAYYIAALSAFAVGTLSDRIFAPFWPPNVVLLCVFLIAPSHRWPIHLAATFAAHAIAEAGVGMGVFQMLVAFATNCAVALLGAVLLRLTVAQPPWLGTTRAALLYIIITAGLAPALAAFGGAFVPIAGGEPMDRYWAFYGHWYVANALPCLTLGPIVLSFLGTPNRAWLLKPAEWSSEAIIGAGALLALCVIAGRLTGVVAPPYFPALLLLPLPVVLWMTFRFGVRGASAAILVVTAALVSHALDRSSPLLGNDAETNGLALQLLLTGLAVPILLLGAAVDEARVMQTATRWLVGSVLTAHDQERREVARELHESTGQDLVAAKLLATRLQRNAPSTVGTLTELTDLLQRSIASLRSMSYDLHPPLLDEAGLAMALRSYAGRLRAVGFTLEIEMPDDIERLPPDVELLVFRVAEEVLEGMCRHSDSRAARLLFVRGADARRPDVVLTITNERTGPPPTLLSKLLHGVPQDALHGTRLASVRERVQQVGGVLDLQSETGFTLVRATVPLAQR
jgi:signal transduction histidine kinase